jgi:hypothetical protein
MHQTALPSLPALIALLRQGAHLIFKWRKAKQKIEMVVPQQITEPLQTLQSKSRRYQQFQDCRLIE